MTNQSNIKFSSESNIRQLKGVGEAIAQLLAKLNIHTTLDLLFHLPRGYEDRSRIMPIRGLRVGQAVLIEGYVESVDIHPKRSFLTVQINDGSASIYLRYFKIYPRLKEKFVIGKYLRLFGEVKLGNYGLEIAHPEIIQAVAGSPLPPSRLTAIYPLTEGLSQAKMRQLVALALDNSPAELHEILPEKDRYNQYNLKDALHYIHIPPADANVLQLEAGQHPAQLRLIFEELVAHQISLLTRRYWMQTIPSPAFKASVKLLPQLLAQLPYKPTHAQIRVSQEIYDNLSKPTTMLRLIQGDVGAGKTLVAAMAACQVLEAGWQVALMAPTELLAEQHFANFKTWFESMGIRVGWLSGKQKGKARATEEIAVKSGESLLVIGTHALFQESVTFKQLGLVIIDEQHRFGVDQRLALKNKGHAQSSVIENAKSLTPHQLVMTATPIPRTLAMSVYGDLDTSVIDELPPGRTPITTVTVPFEKRDHVVERLKAHCNKGHQAYWVCTLVEQSEVLDAKAAETTYTDLITRLPELNIGLVHGRLKPGEKLQVMHAFKQGEIDILVATTVIEVGVDVPNASLMIIENAERLGLSQLHQLRGRVGRGTNASYCVLMYKSPLSQNGKTRLSTLRNTNDGFAIAEVDLELRGPGEMLGTRQTGVLGFRLAFLARDQYLLPQAQLIAKRVLDHHPIQAEMLLQRWLPNAPRYAMV